MFFYGIDEFLTRVLHNEPSKVRKLTNPASCFRILVVAMNDQAMLDKLLFLIVDVGHVE